MAPKKAFRFKKKTIAIKVFLGNRQTLIDKVIDAKISPSGFLAYHLSMSDIGYSITHVPTGLEIAVRFSDGEAKELIQRIDGEDWNFQILTLKLEKQLRRKYSALVQNNS